MLSAHGKNALEKVRDQEIKPEHFAKWSGFDLLLDLYRLRSADQLAFKDIGIERLGQYKILINSFLNQKSFQPDNDPFRRNMVELMAILQKFLNGDPSDHFQIDLKTGKIVPLINHQTH
jgi:hypothetical protein